MKLYGFVAVGVIIVSLVIILAFTEGASVIAQGMEAIGNNNQGRGPGEVSIYRCDRGDLNGQAVVGGWYDLKTGVVNLEETRPDGWHVITPICLPAIPDDPDMQGDQSMPAEMLWRTSAAVSADLSAETRLPLQWGPVHATGGTGPPGPQGPEGPEGPQGPQGPVDPTLSGQISTLQGEIQGNTTNIAGNKRIADANLAAVRLIQADDWVTGRRIAATTIGGGNIVSNFLADRHVPSELIDDRMIGANAVGQSELKGTSVGTAELINGEVTESKLSAAVRTKLNATGSGGSTDLSAYRTAAAQDTVTTNAITTALEPYRTADNQDLVIVPQIAEQYSNLTPRYLDVEPGTFVRQMATSQNFHVTLHGYPLDALPDVDNIRVLIQGQPAHSAQWTARANSRVIDFVVDTTESANIIRNLRGAATVNVQVEFRDGGSAVENSPIRQIPAIDPVTIFSGDYNDLTNRPAWREVTCVTNVCTIATADQDFMVELTRTVSRRSIYINVIANRAQLGTTGKSFIHHTQNPDTASTNVGANLAINASGQLVAIEVDTSNSWTLEAVYAK